MFDFLGGYTFFCVCVCRVAADFVFLKICEILDAPCFILFSIIRKVTILDRKYWCECVLLYFYAAFTFYA